MITALALRLDAPMLSFGGIIIDHHGITEQFPYRSLITGLIGNALGLTHADGDRLNDLQSRLRFAARWDVTPTLLRDYQTADLTQPHLNMPGWTTWGIVDKRSGSSSARTRQRIQWYHQDGLMTIALTVKGDTSTLDQIEHALRRPARPLFIGRKSCLPARPILDHPSRYQGSSLREILTQIPLWDRYGRPMAHPDRPILAIWPDDDDPAGHEQWQQIYGLRDWRSQLPLGSYGQYQGPIVLSS